MLLDPRLEFPVAPAPGRYSYFSVGANNSVRCSRSTVTGGTPVPLVYDPRMNIPDTRQSGVTLGNCISRPLGMGSFRACFNGGQV